MKNIMFTVMKSWLCATGVIVISAYSVVTNLKDTPGNQKKAAEVASRVSSRRWISEYKPKKRHSSVLKKKTEVKVGTKTVKKRTFLPNPIFLPFVNALDNLTTEVREIARDGKVMFDDGFGLENKDGKPLLIFPETYTRVKIGCVAIGDVLKNGFFSVHRKGPDGTALCKVDEISLDTCKRLREPEFYCTDVTYSAIPATRQVDSIRMRGNLCVRNTGNAYAMVDEIADWMKEDYGAVDLDVAIPAGTLALKKLKIGEGLDVVVSLNWKKHKTNDGSDARIDITFTVGELKEENQVERRELGQAVDEARVVTLKKTGVNYFTVRSKVEAEAVKRKTVY